MIRNASGRRLAELKSVQVRVMPRKTVDGHSEGTIYYTTPTRARMLNDLRAVEIIGMPSERQPNAPGPQEIKADEASKKVLRRTDKFPFDRYSVMYPEWRGATVACIGGGPSATPEHFAMITAWRAQCTLPNGEEHAQQFRRRVIAVNNAYAVCPNADISYFADKSWFDRHKAAPEFVAFAGQKCSIEQTGEQIDDASVHLVRNDSSDAFQGGRASQRNALRTGGNSGFQAVGLAIAAGAKRIILVGYDMHFPNGKSHWHAGHPNPSPEGWYSTLYARAFRDLGTPAGMEILNASPISLIDVYPKMELSACLAMP